MEKRQHKYKAWHTEKKHWIDNFMNIGVLVGLDMMLNQVSDVEVVEFTGLLDAKGQEIYEGDIIRIDDATAKVVFWGRPPAFGLDFSHNAPEWCEDWSLSDDCERMEVIGNIYENPDLIAKEEK